MIRRSRLISVLAGFALLVGIAAPASAISGYGRTIIAGDQFTGGTIVGSATDGQTITFSVLGPDETGGIYTMARGSETPRRVTDREHGGYEPAIDSDWVVWIDPLE